MILIKALQGKESRTIQPEIEFSTQRFSNFFYQIR
jgi:hypothetical protein